MASAAMLSSGSVLADVASLEQMHLTILERSALNIFSLPTGNPVCVFHGFLFKLCQLRCRKGSIPHLKSSLLAASLLTSHLRRKMCASLLVFSLVSIDLYMGPPYSYACCRGYPLFSLSFAGLCNCICARSTVRRPAS